MNTIILAFFYLYERQELQLKYEIINRDVAEE